MREKTLSTCLRAIAVPAICLFIVIMSSCATKEMFPNEPIYNVDGTITLPLNAMAYGVRNPKTNEIIEPMDVIIPVNNKVHVIATLKHNMPKERKYVLIVMVDNVQRPFIMDGEEAVYSVFSLKRQDEIALNIEVDVFDDDGEIIFLWFVEPFFASSQTDVETTTHTLVEIRDPLTCRFFLRNVPEQPRFPSPIKEVGRISFDDTIIFLRTLKSEDLSDRTIISRIRTGEKLYIVLSNKRDVSSVYAFGTFVDWHQQAFEDGTMVRYVDMFPKTTIITELTVPEVDKETPYQLFVLPMAFGSRETVSQIGYMKVEASYRMTILPDNED